MSVSHFIFHSVIYMWFKQIRKMDIKKICRLCFKADIQNDFINIMKVPSMIEEISAVYRIEVSEGNGISTLICADCNNKTIAIIAQLETARKTQAKIAVMIGMKPEEEMTSTSVDPYIENGKNEHDIGEALNELQTNKKGSSTRQKEISSSGNSCSESGKNDNANIQVLEELRAKKKASSAKQKEELNLKGTKRKENRVNPTSVENFNVGEKVKCYDINSKRFADAVVVKRVTYGQYAICIGNQNRIVMRKAIFLSKK